MYCAAPYRYQHHQGNLQQRTGVHDGPFFLDTHDNRQTVIHEVSPVAGRNQENDGVEPGHRIQQGKTRQEQGRAGVCCQGNAVGGRVFLLGTIGFSHQVNGIAGCKDADQHRQIGEHTELHRTDLG